MNLLHPTQKKMSLLFSLLLIVTACSKDADLLSDYVIAKDGDLQSIALLVDDSFFMAPGQNEIVMDVLNNDNFNSEAQVAIVETSAPQNGEVVINEDNTLTYTPQMVITAPEETSVPETTVETPVADTFTYTTEVTTSDNEVSRQEATVTISTSDMGELLAFPGAEGFGKYTTGGRGGIVIHVTNLNDSGPGSLRAAIEQKVTRTIVFDVGGDIFLTGQQLGIYAGQGNLTIAGETAPYPGITVRGDNISSNSYGATVDIGASNVIIRYITVRENNNRTENDGIRLRNDSGMNNIILDHVTISHGTDENLDLASVKNATIQNSILSNNNGSGCFLFGPYNYDISFVGNYLSHNSFRNALLGYGENGENIEFINNIIYGYEEGMFMTFGHNADVIGNIYKAFSNNTPDYASIQWVPNGNNNLISDGSFHLSDNFQLNNHQHGLYDNNAMGYNISNRIIGNSQITNWAGTVLGIEQRVFGNNLPGNSLFQDSMDEQAIMDYFNNSGSFGSLIVPSKESNYRPSDYDTDQDGMSDSWEINMFGDLSKSPQGDENGDGYTNLETFFFSLIQ